MNPAAPPCACSSKQQEIGGGDYLVATLWTVVVGDTWTTEDVMDEFGGGLFDPGSNGSTTTNGTKAYTIAHTGEEGSAVLTMAVFDTEERAELAREEERSFVIAEDRLAEGRMSFHFGAASEGGCVTESAEDKFLSTCLWRLADGSALTVQDVVDEFRDGRAPILTEEYGFVEYGGATVAETDEIFSYHVFETREDAHAANRGTMDFVANGALYDNIEDVVCTEGRIAFDYRQSSCTSDNDFPDQTTSATNSSASLFVADTPMIVAAATACTVMLLLWACMLVPSQPKVYPSSLDDAPPHDAS